MSERYVFVVNKGPHSFSEAERFGELVYCTDGLVDKFDTALMYRELEDAMRDSQANDYILLTSLTSLCAIACAMFAARHKCLNLLIHKPGEGYILRSLHFQ